MDIVQPVASIAVVFLLMAGTFWLLKRSRMVSFRAATPGAKGPRMQRVGRLQLTPQHTLHLVRLGGRTLLVGTHSAGLTVVQAIGDSDSAAGSSL